MLINILKGGIEENVWINDLWKRLKKHEPELSWDEEP